MMIESVLTNEQIEKGRQEVFSTSNPFCPCDSKTMRKAARWTELALLQSPMVSQWVNSKEGDPHCDGTYVVRINKHGHLRLGERVLNSDTLRYQWQVDGEICSTVTHYLPIPGLKIS